LFLSLSIGRQLPPLKLDATSTSVSLIWVSLEGTWIDIAWAQALDTAEKNGALVDKILGGLVIMFGPEESGDDMSVAVETAFALHDILNHHKSLSRGGNNRSSFRMVCGVGMLPYDANNVLRALATLPHTPLLKELRAKAASTESGSIWVNATLHMGTQHQYTYDEPEEPTTSPEDTGSLSGDPEWWRLSIPQSQSDGARHPKRGEMTGQGDAFARIDPMLARLAQTGQGGMVTLVGLPGTGKTRMLDTIIGEQQSIHHPWLIHLRGRNHIQYQPFGAIRHWLGGEIAKPRRAPVEQRALHISTFQQSLIGLLKSKPLLLVVDDAHLLDSGSLDTLRAILPLMASYQLIILLTAQPAKGDSVWREVVASAERAIPNRCVRIDLPESLAFKPRPRPEDLMTAYVLACAAVLGNEFPAAVLRRMSGVPNLEQRLASLKKDGYLIRAATGQYWRFLQTAERDHIYEELNPQYRAILHWYARQALKTLGMPAEEHVHQAGLPEAALKLSIRMAQQALDLESPAEAAVHFKRALGYYEGSHQPIELLLGYAASLMSMGEWSEAQSALDTLKSTSDLSLRDEVTLLIYQGELNYRVGEVATLFRLYEEASQKLNQLQSDEKHPSEEVSIIYAQALARFKRGEIEMARSMTGGALVIAQRAGLDRELAHLWELLAKIHQIRGESTQAQTAIAKAIQLLTSTGYQWQQIEPLEISGGLALARGHLSDASKFLVQALALAESAGDQESAVRLHQKLGRIAMYRGELEDYVTQQRAALDLALFSEHTTHTVEAYKELSDSLTLKGDFVEALQVATLGIQLAEKRADVAALGFAYCALAGVSVGLNCNDDAAQALATARQQIPDGPHPTLQMATEFAAMELALAQEDGAAFMAAWQAARAIELEDDTFLRARIQLMLASFRAFESDWNDAARELELASKAFATMSATFWQNRAKNMLRDIAPNVPGYSHRTTQIRPPINPDSSEQSPTS
jgi:tetratricopeptide (TPR) repeat protein